MGDRVRVRRFADDPHPMPRQRVEDRGVITFYPDHILFEKLQRLHLADAGDDLDARHVRYIIAGHQRAAILAIEGVANAQRNVGLAQAAPGARMDRSEEHTSELQSLMRISYAVFCLKKKK